MAFVPTVPTISDFDTKYKKIKKFEIEKIKKSKIPKSGGYSGYSGYNLGKSNVCEWFQVGTRMGTMGTIGGHMERINDSATYKAVQFALKICDNRFIGSARACSIAANYWHANEQDTRKHVRKRLWDTACKEAQAQNGYYSIYVTGADVPMMNAYNKGYCLICPDCITPQYFDINDNAAINRAYVSPCINPECGYVDIQQRGNIRKELYKYYVSTGIIPD